MHEHTNPRTALWFTTAGALTAMAVLAFPGVAAIERLLASAAAGGAVSVFVAVAAAGYLLDGALPIVVPGWSGIAQFAFGGEILLIAWLVTGGIRSGRLARRDGSPAKAGPSNATVRVSV